MKNLDKKQLWMLVSLAAGAIFVACVVVLLIAFFGNKENTALEYKQEPAAAETEPSEPEAPAETPLETPDEPAPAEPESEPVPVPVDFAALKAVNPDVYAWIEIPGTVIDYPVVQNAENNSYYLKRGWDGNALGAGAIFSENYNSLDFSDRNTIIYGHKMANETMFTQLHNFLNDADFFEEYRYVYIYTPEGTLTYEVFAAYSYSKEHILLNHDFSDRAEYEAFFDYVYENCEGNFEPDYRPDFDNDKLLTLSTCLLATNQRRCIVQARLVEGTQGLGVR